MKFIQSDLAEGVRLHLCETDKFKSVTCKLFIQQDLNHREATATALLPLLLRRGSKQFPSTLELAQELESLYAAEYGSDVLKIGERQILEFYFQMIDPILLPEGDDHLKRGLQTFWQIVMHPLDAGNKFSESYFKQEKKTLEQELKGIMNDKRSYAIFRAISLMCSDEPFGIHKYGDIENLETLTNEEVYGQYQKLVHEYPLDIFLVGPNLTRAVEIIQELVTSRSEVVELKLPQQVRVKEPRFIEETTELQQAILIKGYRTNCSYSADDYYALLVGNGILGGFAHSKLFVNVREKASLAYYVGSSIEGSKGLLTITAGISGEQQEQANSIIEEQLHKLQAGEISQDELDQTKKGLISAMTAMSDHPARIIDRNLIGLVHQQMRSIDEVVDKIALVEHDDVVKVMQKLELDTTYVLRAAEQEEA